MDRRYERLAALRSIAAVQKVLSTTGGGPQAAAVSGGSQH
jgi:hypothetical protein